MICEIHSFVKSIYVTSFLSISCLSNSEYWSQKTSQSGNIHSINKMSMLQAWFIIVLLGD